MITAARAVRDEMGTEEVEEGESGWIAEAIAEHIE
jgi:hypothetical protein